MRVAIQASEQSEMSHYLDFPREHVPSHGALQSWVEEQIKRDGHDEFSQALQRFLFAYALEGKGLPKVNFQVFLFFFYPVTLLTLLLNSIVSFPKFIK